ncbi:SGNH/GDSL hydrolase family protein [Pelagibacterium xiamenense]|uniref:SGNH/GDSL hydrolase family protein n=1 Tax=Pelagibacterium xiamenense TaxID=2901140 RepID=UPI001E32843F|nr:DUF459 domain-containing protein [Pelagibacterium xiamenense]MCD7060537.1 DUF459 domain-containing protein [Pelagibacterium xiamenense]
MVFRRFVIFLSVLMLALPLAAPEALGQNERPRRSLFEVLFGNDDQPPAQEPVTVQPQPSRTQPSRPVVSQPQSQPQPTDIEKSENATRIAVFGDSLAVDLARALERFYAEDPETVILGQGVGSSGFVRDDFFDWNAALDEEIAEDSFDIAVVMVGINDRQALGGAGPLTEAWKAAYSARIEAFLGDLRAAGKPVVWVELPPMAQPTYSSDMVQISSLHRQAVQASGGEWVETFERFTGEAGGYSEMGPDLSGQIVSMRKSDGIHFSSAGADKLAFYIDRAIGEYHSGGGITTEVADPLAGTDAAGMQRPPFQGLDQAQLVEIAGVVQQIGGAVRRAEDLLVAGSEPKGEFDLEALLEAPAGRVDAFGLGVAAEDIPGGR